MNSSCTIIMKRTKKGYPQESPFYKKFYFEIKKEPSMKTIHERDHMIPIALADWYDPLSGASTIEHG